MEAFLFFKRFLLLTVLSVFLCLPTIAVKAQYTEQPTVTSFQSTIDIQGDGTLFVEEIIMVDFKNEPHHGIIRTIPLEYKGSWGEQLNLRFEFKNLWQNEDQNTPVPVEISYSNGNVDLKIGDADVYVTGLQIYELEYTIQRAFAFQHPTHDEIYWNVTGDAWEMPIESVQATVRAPFNFKPEDLKAECYTGSYGSGSQECSFDIEGSSISYDNTQALAPREGLTIVAGFPKGFFKRPSEFQQALWFLADNWGLFVPIIVFGIFFALWWHRGRDAASERDTIVPEYKAPEGLTPAEAGTLLDERLDMQDISATIVDLAVRGYIKIIEKKDKKLFFTDTNYEFVLLKDVLQDDTLKAYEREILQAIFGPAPQINDRCDLSDLKNSFYRFLPTINSKVYQSVVKDGYFTTSPEQIRNLYLGIGIGLVTFTFVLLGFLLQSGFSVTLPIGLILSGIIIVVFSRIMPARTSKGVEMKRRILGLEEFIRTAEKDRLKFQEKENIFEKILPFALALGVADKWAKAFEGLAITPPSWYQGSTGFGPNFTTYVFVRHMQQLSRDMNTVFQSAPRSSGSGGAWSGGSGFGGGFSGGGFGGGGGKAW